VSNIDTLDPYVPCHPLPTTTPTVQLDYTPRLRATVSQVPRSALHFRSAQRGARARQQPAYLRAAAQNLPFHDCQRPLPQRHIQKSAATDQRLHVGHHQTVRVQQLPSLCFCNSLSMYAWQNTYRELTLYYTNSQLKVEEFLSPLASPSAAAASPSTTVAMEQGRGSSSTTEAIEQGRDSSSSSSTLSSAKSNHFKRKSIIKCKQVTDTANLTEQLFNSKTYRCEVFQILRLCPLHASYNTPLFSTHMT
jgi:hypothetical protein